MHCNKSWVFLNISESINGFSQIGDVALSKDNVVWSTPEWSDEFKIEFDVIVEKELSKNGYLIHTLQISISLANPSQTCGSL